MGQGEHDMEVLLDVEQLRLSMRWSPPSSFPASRAPRWG
jgi:hypothetical protein